MEVSEREREGRERMIETWREANDRRSKDKKKNEEPGCQDNEERSVNDKMQKG